MQPGCVPARLEPPGRGQGVGQGRLLVEQLGRPVAHPPGLDQDHLGVVAEQVGAGAPRRRPATAATTPCRRTARRRRCGSHWWRPHGALGHQAGGPLAHGARRRPAPGSRTARPTARSSVERWSADVEPGQPVDLVAPQVDADRLVGGRREHVDDAAPHGQLAAVLDQRLAPVAQGHQLADQLVDARPGRPSPPRRVAAAVRHGPSRWSTALTGATTMSGTGRAAPRRPAPTAGGGAAPWCGPRG